MTKLNALLPNFPGFYHSILDGQIDLEIDCAIQNLQEEDENLSWEDAYEKVEKDFDYSKARLAITQGWVEVWEDTYEIPVEFVQIHSPREYNFTTDKVEVLIPECVLMDLGKRCLEGDLKKDFEDILKKWFTSYDGFMSFYSNDIEDEEWQNLEEYNDVQWSAVLAAHVQNTGEEIEYDDDRIYETAQQGWIR